MGRCMPCPNQDHIRHLLLLLPGIAPLPDPRLNLLSSSQPPLPCPFPTETAPCACGDTALHFMLQHGVLPEGLPSIQLNTKEPFGLTSFALSLLLVRNPLQVAGLRLHLNPAWRLVCVIGAADTLLARFYLPLSHFLYLHVVNVGLAVTCCQCHPVAGLQLPAGLD